ncbi:MAG: DUF3047 domain-containing protein [Desulfobulbaceae bacterium]|nr:DUF3047 domain-containing protein [Desulfobulbaceae bacterium]
MTTDKDKQKKLLPLFIFLSISLVAATTHAGESADSIVAGNFSQAQDLSRLPDDWQPLTFKNIASHTTYRLVQDHDTTVIEAVSQASSSGLTRKFPINPLAYPVLSWKWKVANIYEKGDVTKKEGDDYPARIYITFAYDADKVGLWERVKFNTIKLLYGEYPPVNAINYIWASKAPQELITPNPYTDRVKMIVIESGSDMLNQWIAEKRDIAADYRKAFGEDPPAISGIAIMTDSDNTGESATAWYGDIIFSRKQ